MLKINLLPPTINAGATRGKMIGLWVFIWIVTVGGFMFWLSQLNAQADKIKADTAALEPTATEADNTQKKADGINAESAAVRAKADFIGKAKEYNSTAYQTVVNNVRDYTIKSVLYRDMNITGNTVTMTAYAPSLAEVGRYLLWMEHNPDISNVSIALTSIPGFPYNGSAPVQDAGQGVGGQTQTAGIRPPGGAGHDFTVTLTLVKPLGTPPAFPGAASGGQGGPGGGGAGGGMTSGGGMLMGMGGGPGGGGGPTAGGGAAPAEPGGGGGAAKPAGGGILRNRGGSGEDN